MKSVKYVKCDSVKMFITNIYEDMKEYVSTSNKQI